MPKVAVVRCDSYHEEEVYESLKKAIGLLGGIEKFVPSGKKVLLKPNLLSGKAPEKAVTTHPAVFEALVRILKAGDYDITYGDSPGFGTPKRVAKQAGLCRVAEKYDIPLADFTNGEIVQYPEGNACKQFEIASGVLETDCIISLCKMKTHQLTRITGAVKNQLGCVFGFNKAAFHARFPDAVSFSRMLIDLNQLLHPSLYIMDGVLAMEGNGPASGRPVKMNVLLVSEDPVALDSVFCRMVGLNPEYIPSIVFGREYGLGTYLESEVELTGDDIHTFVNTSFDVIRTPVRDESFGMARFLRSPLVRKPVLDKTKCVKCGICVDACPVEGKAINFRNTETKGFPEFNYAKCIRCYCCQEMCPENAIDVKTPLLGRLLLYKK